MEKKEEKEYERGKGGNHFYHVIGSITRRYRFIA